ncbi:class I SAM-dependent methyltransferase [Actinokineospora soli]
MPQDEREEFFYDLVVGVCADCSMVQQANEVPPGAMFHADYPYRSSGSAVMRKHFDAVARHFLDAELTGADPFIVEIGSNDGVMLRTVSDAGVRHLGVEPSGGAAEVASAHGVDVVNAFFDEDTAQRVRAEHGPADVVFSANTFSHIADLGSILRGVDALLTPTGVFVFEDRYLADIVDNSAFDQIYDEHFYLFSATSVRELALRSGFELVDVERLSVHGGAIRYTVARAGARTPSPSVAGMIAEESARGLFAPSTFERFADDVRRIRADLVDLLTGIRAEGKTVVGYGATAKSATAINYCGITPELVPYICDSTPEKHGRLSPGARIPVRAPGAFGPPYPDYALLFAWNHADEIMAKERAFREAGGRWVLYVPDVHIV